MLFTVTGTLHFVRPAFFLAIVPPWLPSHGLLVALSGVAELLGAAGLLSRTTRRVAGWWLLALLIAVFPANIQMLMNAQAEGATSARQLALWLRLPIQPLLMYWIWRVAIAPTRGATGVRELPV